MAPSVAIAFGKYALQRKLAEGGMAEVYLARQSGMEGFEKVVVLKRILPALSKEENFVKMFLNEARVAARLNHPNVVQIWDLGKIEELYFIAMEFVHGEDLRSIVTICEDKRMRPPPGLVCRIMADTLAGLHYAHTRVGTDGKPLGLVHRDVSPQNVLVTYEGGLKLVDFGIAKATRATSEQTQAGLFKGKFAYMSPEQSRGQPVDARCDVFSVGILLWELICWQRLFRRSNDMATLIAVSEDTIPSPRSLDSSVPPELEAIIMRALARPLAERYQSAQEMRSDLESLIRKQGWEADGIALGTFMRALFADKLAAQDEDIRAAGLASLEDLLLRVEQSSPLSWMQQRGVSDKRTPSIGLPPASHSPNPGSEDSDEITGVDNVPPMDSGPTLIAPQGGDDSKPIATKAPMATSSMRATKAPVVKPPPVRPPPPPAQSHTGSTRLPRTGSNPNNPTTGSVTLPRTGSDPNNPTPPTSGPVTLPNPGANAPTEPLRTGSNPANPVMAGYGPPPPAQAPQSPSDARTSQANLPPQPATREAFAGAPTVVPGYAPQDAFAGAPTVVPGYAQQGAPQSSMSDTAKSKSYNLPPRRHSRALVIGIAAVIAGIGIAIVFWAF
jgi:eukaryotic-like serine/threonine-protein kinase